jgi:hypothetical protein
MVNRYDEIDCIYRLLGDERCKECIRDYSSNHPNNLDCPRYHPARRVCGEAIVTLDRDIIELFIKQMRNGR